MSTKQELEKILKLLKEETAKLHKVNKQRFNRIGELEERVKVQALQLSLFFEVLKLDPRHSGFAQIVFMLGNIKSFWKNKSTNTIEKQIKEMEENGLFDIDEDNDDDIDFPPFLRGKK